MSTADDPPEEYGSPPEDICDPVFNSSSEGSLDWDSGGQGLSFNNSDIVDPFLVSDLHQPGISLVGGINKRFRINTSERTADSIDSTTSQDTVKMPTELEKKRHRALITSAELLVDDDIKLISDFSELTLQYLKEYSDKALSAKSEIQTAQVFLSMHDEEDYNAHYKDRAVAAKTHLLEFIRKSQAHLAKTKDPHDDSSDTLNNSSTQLAATTKIKYDRASRASSSTVAELKTITERMRALLIITPSSDGDFRNLEDKVKTVTSRATFSYDEAKAVYVDAVESAHAEAAVAIETGLTELKTIRAQLEDHLSDQKSNLGICGSTSFARMADTRAPMFSGDTNEKLDYYTFKEEFEEYLKSRPLSSAERFKLLQKTCLTGSAYNACKNLETIDDIWRQLKETFGNVGILISNKIEEIRRLGKCTGSLSKQREWGLDVKTKLDHAIKLARKHRVENNLYYSPIIPEIEQSLPMEAQKDFQALLKTKQREAGTLGMDVPRNEMVEELVRFLSDFVEDLTFQINYKLSFGAKLDTNKAAPDRPSGRGNPPSGKKSYTTKQKVKKQATPTTTQATASSFPAKTVAQSLQCALCNGSHTHIHYCEVFQKARVKDRYGLLKDASVCFRCLRLDSKPDLSNREAWWQSHKDDCEGDWVCEKGKCGGKVDIKQSHFLMCAYHIKENKDTEDKFIKSLDKTLISSNVKFLYHNGLYNVSVMPVSGPITKVDLNSEPDVEDPAIYFVEHLIKNDSEFLIFYDSGCTTASISTRARQLLAAEEVRPGPTLLEVAGGNHIMLDTGEVRFHLDLAGSNKAATITGLELENITGPFPLWPLCEAYDDLTASYKQTYPNGGKLPPVRDRVGGIPVDIMIGIKYLKYFPKLLYQMPCGLSIYESMFKTGEKSYGILGGPHKAWRQANEVINLANPKMFFTQAMRAFCEHERVKSLPPPVATPCMTDVVEVLLPPCECDLVAEVDVNDMCAREHCKEHSDSSVSTDICDKALNIRTTLKNFQEIDELGGTVDYRCVKCRNCADCRRGELLERVSLKEEVEQSLIESCLSLNTETATLKSYLPFLVDPADALAPTIRIAEKVLESQIRLAAKNPDTVPGIIKSHNKLRDKGYVIPYDELSAEEKIKMDATPEPGYFIPWRTVYKAGSISTPVRLVFDASQSSPSGASLNSILAKGQNTLARVLHILVRFRSKYAAVATDIKMAYNGIRLQEEHYKYQRYLWKEEMDANNPTKVMVIRTFIYGIRCAGNTTIAGLRLLSERCKQVAPEHARGADALVNSTYMDDVLDSQDTLEDCHRVSQSLLYTLQLGSLEVKAFTYSGTPPSEEVSSDGVHIGVLGMLWAPAEDTLTLDIKELYLGKAKRGRLPDPVVGDVRDALKKQFTRRVVTGKVANLFDPAGLITAISSKYKLDLHELCTLQLDWDDAIPEVYLDTWVENLNQMQELRAVKFKRTVIPEGAATTDLELITSVDASSNIAIACVHSRVKLKCGGYHCQLLAAKSKLVSTLTVPRAELRAAVMGASLTHVIKSSLGNRVTDSIFVTDSTVSLYWLNQDERPLCIGVRNSVIEVRRLSVLTQWYHVDTSQNIADLGTRPATVAEISSDSDWQNGKNWMRGEYSDMPIRRPGDITLSNEEKRIAGEELKTPKVDVKYSAADQASYSITTTSLVGERYKYSGYLIDPCVRTWDKTVRILALVHKFFRLKIPSWETKIDGKNAEVLVGQISDLDISRSERYFFRKATQEVMQFSREKDWKHKTTLKDDILYYDSRILDGQQLVSIVDNMWDTTTLSFVQPVVDRYSPVAFSIMLYCHEKVPTHWNIANTVRESRTIAFILRGRELAKQIREKCVTCRRYRARQVEVEMSTVHPNRLMIAPAFYYAQVDLFGPYQASCEHNHRSTVSVWGVVFKDPTTCAISVHCMQGYSTQCFIQAYVRFATRHGHPSKLFIDEGSQLVKGCNDARYSIIDVTRTLNSKWRVGVEYETAPVSGHNYNGVVERAIKEVKKIFRLTFAGLKLDIMSYETSFAFIANELNNMPICLGSRTDDLDNLDIITPSRLLLGRNNRRAMTGHVTLDKPGRLLEQLDKVSESWWRVWKDEKLVEYVPRPSKWLTTNEQVAVGDIVLFLKHDNEKGFGGARWKIGRIVAVEESRDDIPRVVTIEYRNPDEKVFRETRRSVRKIAVIHHEGDLPLVEELNLAAKTAGVNFFRLRDSRPRTNVKEFMAQLVGT